MTDIAQDRRLALKPREARVVVTRILRQAEWDWGLEPAVGTVVLAAHLAGLHGLDALDRDWDAIRASRPEAIVAATGTQGVGQFDCSSCHAFVAAPAVLDRLVADAVACGRSVIEIRQCESPTLLAVLAAFGPRYAMTIEVENGPWCTIVSGRTNGEHVARPIPAELSAADYRVGESLWQRLRARSAAYLVPESEVSRSHAGDGTRAFPLSAQDPTTEAIGG